MSNFEKKLSEQVEKRYEKYKTYRINLSTANLDHQISLAGNFLCIDEVSSGSAQAQIKIDHDRSDPINLQLHTIIKTMFYTLFLSNEAQPGEWIEILVGCDFDLIRREVGKIIESQSCVVITNVAANTNTVGPASVSDIVLFKADVVNVGVVWIDFGIPAVQNACLPMDPGDWSRHHLSNLNQLNVNFEIANERLIVVPEV